MTKNTTIETRRLILRPITEDDAADIFEYACGANVGVNAGWKPHETLAETREIMQTVFIDKELVYGIVEKDSSKLIGSIGLIEDPKREYDRVKMLGYAIGEAYWGKGYMSEAATALVEYAFREFDLELISAYCYPHNGRSRRVLEKLGFRYEGRLSRASKLYNSEVYDDECYALKGVTNERE